MLQSFESLSVIDMSDYHMEKYLGLLYVLKQELVYGKTTARVLASGIPMEDWLFI